MRETKITLGEMRLTDVWGLVVFCTDYKCSHSTKIDSGGWSDAIRISDIEPRFVCKACGRHGSNIQPDFDQAPLPSPRRIVAI